MFLRKNFHLTTNISKKQKTLVSFGFTKQIRHNEAGQCSYVVLNFDPNLSLNVLINKVLIKIRECIGENLRRGEFLSPIQNFNTFPRRIFPRERNLY